MAIAVESAPVSKKMGRPKGDRDDVTVKVPRSIAAKSKAIAKDRGQTLAEYLEEKLAVPVDKDYAAMLRRIDETPG